jgi:periplasmic divalent cation tolerance protein
MQINFVYMTAGSEKEAKTVAKALVESKLAACVNIIPGMRSVYVWEGDIQEDTEWVLIAKTTADNVPGLIDTVKELHSYDCPCIVGIPAAGGNAAFLDWIAATVSHGKVR